MHNKPPMLAFSEGGAKVTGPPTAVAATFSGTVNQPIEMSIWVEDPKAHERGLDNTATARDLALLLAAMPPEGIEVLSRQQLDGGISSGLPRGTRVAHKGGDIARHHHDAALVFPEGRKPYGLVVMTRGFEAKEAAALVREVSRTVWRSVGRPS